MNAQDLKQRAIYVTRHGSHAYGLNTETSDLDIKGVLVGPKSHYLGFLERVEQVEEREPNDLVLYEATKFFKLAADCNPNIIEVLWTADEDVLFFNGFGQTLVKLRQDFLSQKAKHTFSGYAMAQLKRMRNHHSWMKNPPKEPKNRGELDLPLSKQWCSVYDQNPDRLKEQTEEIQVLYAKEVQWRENRRQWESYQEWLAGRNPKRHELEAKFGYDTKHGMHLVRLLRMGMEILMTGRVVVKRPDREELLAIRNHGIWSYERIVAYAEKMDAELTEFYRSGKSPLPKEPNRKLLNEACMRLVDSYLMYGCQYPKWDGSVR